MVLLACVTTFSEQIATLSDGKKVILLDSGTWHNATPDEIQKVLANNKRIDSVKIAMADSVAAKKVVPKAEDGAPKRISLVDVVKSDTSFDFRKFRWGMEKGYVKLNENAKLIKDSENILQYEMEYLGYNCQVIYTFESNKLQKTELRILQDHVDPASYFKDYEDLKQYLSPIYGPAESDRYRWKNDLYKEDRSKWGFAVSIGFLTCSTVWKSKRSQIKLNISGINHLIATNLEYSSM